MSHDTTPSGPLAGIRVIELGGIGPVPFPATVLAGLGAMAQVASFLLSDYAGYMTGAELVLDGGRSLGKL